MEKISKKQRAHLRELAGRAYEIELSKCLMVLDEQFEKWKSGKMDVWQLSDLIHQFHDGDSRELYKYYVFGKDYPLQIAHAIRNGCLSIEDVEESCRGFVQYLMDGFHIEKDS